MSRRASGVRVKVREIDVVYILCFPRLSVWRIVLHDVARFRFRRFDVSSFVCLGS